MKSYYCQSCWGTQGGQCEATLDDNMLDVTLCPVTGNQEAEWIIVPPKEKKEAKQQPKKHPHENYERVNVNE